MIYHLQSKYGQGLGCTNVLSFEWLNNKQKIMHYMLTVKHSSITLIKTKQILLFHKALDLILVSFYLFLNDSSPLVKNSLIVTTLRYTMLAYRFCPCFLMNCYNVICTLGPDKFF